MTARLRTYLAAPALALGAAATIAAALTLTSTPAQAQITVFDPSNYSQNLLTAARTLQQINNQVRSLQNEAAMLLNQAKNLSRIGFPEVRALERAMERTSELMREAQAIEFRVAGLDRQFRQLFPQEHGRVLASDRQVIAARSRLDASMDAYRHTMGIQAQVAENVQADAALLGALVERSQSAEGALQAAQTTNQLLALSTKQQFQLQHLIAAQYRASATEAARRAQAEIDGRAATAKFLGTGSAYTPR